MDYKKAKKIYLGIDLGTNSCGWAVTDEKFNLIKKGGKHLWGIRLFEEAKTSKERRNHREQRRRLQRRRWRICLLREVMESLIYGKDKDFYTRLDYSSIFDEKKNGKTIWNGERHYSLFNDSHFKDKDFFKKFKTIYHLRKALMDPNLKEEDADPRFVYLAFHHILKYRGNFLDPNEKSTSAKLDLDEILDAFNDIDDAITEIRNNEEKDDDEDSLKNTVLNEELFLCDEEKTRKLNDSFLGNFKSEQRDIKDEETNKKYNKFSSSYLKECLEEIFGNAKNKTIKKAVITLIVGNKVNGKDLFGDEDFDNDDNFKSIDFKKYDEKLEPYLDALDENQKILILRTKEIYDSRELIQIIGNHEYLSEALVERYETHKEQLTRFKKFVKEFFSDKYNLIFKEIEGKDKKKKDDEKDKLALNNYSHYVGSSIIKKEKIKTGKCNREEFYNFLKDKRVLNISDKNIKELEDQSEDPNIKLSEIEENKLSYLKEINDLMKSNQFLVLSHSGENGVIKHQIHLKELNAIIDNLKNLFPVYRNFFEAKDEYGYSNENKIRDIFNFKIPYYIGPLDNNKQNKNSWSKEFRINEPRGKEAKEIYPWNWERKIDKDKAAEEFINRMIKHCTYLVGEKVLPANSLIYQEYKLLNEINKFKIRIKDGDPVYLSQEQKDDLIEEYKKKGHLTKKELDVFARKSLGNDDARMDIPHQEGEKESYFLQATLNSYKDFKTILGTEIDSKNEDMVEKMILTLTLFEDLEIRTKRIKEIAKENNINLTDKQIKNITNKKYKGWGKLSKELLCEIKNDEGISILQAMRRVYKDEYGNDYSKNFMEVINDDDLGFNKKLDKYKEEYIDNKAYTGYRSYIEESYSSPMMKRATIQAMGIIKEVQKLLGDKKIDYYFLETTRSPDASKKGKNGNKFSRYSELEALYKKVAEKINKTIFDKDLKSLESNLNNLKKEAKISALRSQSIFLYFLQMGKDVYTGETINFGELTNKEDNKWNIDHIIPQSMVKDDSLNNIVLVSLTKNQTVKRNVYPIPNGVIEPKGKEVIQALRDMGLMSQEKYTRLTRSVNKPLTDQERLGFINRQLVSTSQSVKALRDVIIYDERQRLIKEYKNKGMELDEKTIEKRLPMVLYPKASITSEFRRDFDLFKCRDTNDFHHAHDAYLNIVIGACYFAKFGQKATIERLNELKEKHSTINANKIFSQDIYNFWARNDEDKYVWVSQETKSGKAPTIKRIKKQLQYQDILFTNRLHQGEGKLFDEKPLSPKKTINKKQGEDTGYTSLKSDSNESSGNPNKKRLALLSDIYKYGYYNSAKNSHLSLVEYDGQKGEKEYSLVAIPNVSQAVDKDGKTKEDSFFDSLGKKNLKIIIPRLLFGTVCEYFDPQEKRKVSRFMLNEKNGKTFVITNIKEAYFPNNITYFCKLISKYNLANSQAGKNGKATGYKLENDEIIFSKNEKDNKPMNLNEPSYHNQNQIITKGMTIKVYDYIKEQISKPIYFNYGIYKKIHEALKEKEEDFKNWDIEAQINLLNSLLSLTRCKLNTGCDLTRIGRKKNSGKLTESNKISPNFRIITQSPTGFYEKVIFELDSNGKRKI